MSTTIMGLCWPLQVPPTAKAVLMSIADQANDQAVCWPSFASLCERTCFGRTAVIQAVQWLEENGYLSIEKIDGRNNRYTINVGRIRQQEIEPVRDANQSAKRTSPPAEPTSVPAAPPPVREADQPVREANPNRKEPSSKPSRTKDKEAELGVLQLVEHGLPQQLAEAFVAHRKRKKAPVTPLAWAGFVREAAKAGWSVEAAVLKSLERNWTGFEAEWVAVDRGRPSADTERTERVRRLTGGLMSPREAGHGAGDVIDI